MTRPYRHVADMTAEEIEEAIKDAGPEAQAALHAKGLPYVTERDGETIAIYPDGSTKILRSLDDLP
ncbi:hypothetical protein [Parvularcula maris]|uniref:Uncharacterized protein n=1 Tax=Parvularcula maris TaxID=2965077 RepID=A0A9X2LAI7_9PROT|nr:hypothetical protein [Parvularcula maris]MCQ8186158.1 hypothetical protein [Parvularcula maris]